MSYNFRIRFFLRDDLRISFEQSEVPIMELGQGRKILLKSHSEDKITETNHLIVVGKNFSSEESANMVGKRTKRALWLTGAKIKLWVDLGKGKPKGGLAKQEKKSLKEERGIEFLEDVHGLTTYQSDEDKAFINFSGALQSRKNAKKFKDNFCDSFKIANDMNKKKTLATELYNLSHFESSTRAKFWMLISAVEVLSPELETPVPINDFVDEKLDNLAEELKSKLESKNDSEWPTVRIDNQIHSFRSEFGNLKNVSIRQKAHKLIRKNLDDKCYANQNANDFFEECYNLRSNLIHSGEISKDVNLKRYTEGLGNLVQDIILENALD